MAFEGCPIDCPMMIRCRAGPLSTPGARSTTDSESEKRQMPRLEKWSAESPAADWAEMEDQTFGGEEIKLSQFS